MGRNLRREGGQNPKEEQPRGGSVGKHVGKVVNVRVKRTSAALGLTRSQQILFLRTRARLSYITGEE